MGIITTIFSDANWTENGKFACDLVQLVKQSGQEVPNWLSEGAMKYSSLVDNEGRFLSNLVIFALKKLWKVFRNLCKAISFIILRSLKFIRSTISLTFQSIVDCNSTKNAVKLALWFLMTCGFLCFLVLVTYLMWFGCDAMLQNSEFLYANLQNIGSDLHEYVRKWMLKEISK